MISSRGIELKYCAGIVIRSAVFCTLMIESCFGFSQIEVALEGGKALKSDRGIEHTSHDLVSNGNQNFLVCHP